MKSVVKNVVAILLLSLPAHGITKTTFFGVGAMIQLLPQNPGGPVDSDSFDMYRSMNVPTQDTMLGPGKAIQTADRSFNLSCAIRNNISHECSLVLNRSSHLQLDMINKKIKYQLSGIAADEIRQKFFIKNEEFHFRSTDGVFSVDATVGHFLLLYSAQGLP